jgi:hypothetical protein
MSSDTPQAQRRRQLLQVAERLDPRGSAVATGRRLLQAAAPQACFSGTFKPDRGAAPCYYCPEGSSTTGPLYNAATSLGQCVCIPGYYATRSSELHRCTACPAGTHRSPQQLDTAPCTPCAALSESVGAGSAYCYCVDGAYATSADVADDGQRCVLCEAGFYCSQQGKRSPCPQYSVSMPGARSRGECICDPSTHYGYLGDAAQCILKPLALQCVVAVDQGAAECGCAEGWHLVQAGARITCSSGCAPGTYAALLPLSQALSHCEPCAADTYAETGDLLLQCTPCPPDRTTGGRRGSSALRDCGCAVGRSANSTACVGCDAGQYFFSSTGGCVACPSGMDSPPDSIGPNACMCPPGSFANADAGCSPCRVGTYSHALSASCSRCPPGFTTDSPGATSLLACRPAAASS